MAFLPTLRIVMRTCTLLCSIIVLGLAAHLTSLTVDVFDVFFDFAALAIAVAVISIISLNVMIAIDYTRRGAFTSMVIVELVWFSVLWVLWLSAASLAAEELQALSGFDGSCDAFSRDINPTLNTACGEISAITGFSFLAWLFLLKYTVALLTYAIISATRGGNPWTTTVNDGLLTARRSDIPASGFDTEKQYSMGAVGGSANVAPTTYAAPSQVYNSPQGSQHAYPPQQQYQQPMVAQV